jgi:hypothetical protein
MNGSIELGKDYIEIHDSIISSLADEELACSICLDVLKKTLVTECLHRFCEECISKSLLQIDAKKDRACPLCRVHIASLRSLR